jgi:tetratricopeptide (TPR) repeat protein
MLGALLVCLQSLEKPEFDDRPANWILYAMLVACGIFLIHNLIDFSLFEPGMLCLFCLIVGAALGVRQTALVSNRRSNRIVPAAVLGLMIAGCATMFIVVAIPVARAEASADAGDAALRQGDLSAAADGYFRASRVMPSNADYLFRAARALEFSPNPTPDQKLEMVTWISLAIDDNPSDVNFYLNRAELELRLNLGEQALRDFSRALELDPNEMSTRLQYAEALSRLSHTGEARQQYEQVLKSNDLLDAAEPKRLSPDEIADIQNKIAQLK